MGKKRPLRKKLQDHFYDHPVQKNVLSGSWAFLVTAVSSFVFAFGFRAFIAPSNMDALGSMRLVSGGVSGIAQVFIAIVELAFGHPIENNGIYDIVYSALYFGINVPVFIISWRGIGKRFAILTFLNVLLVSLFTSLLRYADDSLFHPISTFIEENGGLATRALLGGICTGISSAIMFKIDASAGGIDAVAYYIALKKSVLVGKYSVFINAATITIYTFCVMPTRNGRNAMLFTKDGIINIRNKKVKIEAISEMEDLGKILIGNLPHGATMVKGVGAFTGHDKYIFTMIVSSYEVRQTVQVIREADPHAFVDVCELKQVMGRFFLPPIR